MAAAAAPGHLRPRCPCSSPPWLSSPFLRRPQLPRAFPGRRRQHYSNGSYMGIRESSVFRLGFYADLNGQSNEQEWFKEGKRMFYLRTTNNIRNSIFSGDTPLSVGNPNHEPSGDRRSSNHPSMYNQRERVPSNSIVDRHAHTYSAKCSLTNQFAHALSTPTSVVNGSIDLLNMPSSSKVGISLNDGSSMEAPRPNIYNTEATSGLDGKANTGYENKHKLIAKKAAPSFPVGTALISESKSKRKALAGIYDKVLVVDSIDSAKNVVQLLTTKYKNFVHACDTEVANIDVKKETPVEHGEVICFSIYSEKSDVHADFGNGKTCIWVDVLDGGTDILMEFAPFFENPSIKKVQCYPSFIVK